MPPSCSSAVSAGTFTIVCAQSDSAQYIATAPVPFGDDDPNWELYDTWLLDFIDTEMANGVFDRVGEFVMTIAMVNPPLANQLVPRVLDRASLLDVDSVAKSMVKGGALDLERAIVHRPLRPRCQRH